MYTFNQRVKEMMMVISKYQAFTQSDEGSGKIFGSCFYQLEKFDVFQFGNNLLFSNLEISDKFHFGKKYM